MTDLGLRIAVTVWLVAVAAWDWRERLVPNVLSLPVAAVGLGWRIWGVAIAGSAASLLAVGLAWAGCYGLWRLHILGGGDAKLLMALFALFPTSQFLMLLAGLVVLLGLPRLLLRRMRARPGSPHGPSAHGLRLPSEQDLKTRGRPDAWVLALAGVLYTWWLC